MKEKIIVRRDVRSVLEGSYGARTSRDIPGEPKLSVMYVAAPIKVGENLIGVLSIGKPTRTANTLVEAAQRKFVLGATLSFAAVVIVGLILSAMVTGPITKLTAYAQSVRDGKRSPLPKLGKTEIATLGSAFEEMREALEGKRYIEQYVQTLTHEFKSPLSAIHGAAELLKEEMKKEDKDRFLGNILRESERLQGIVEKMLLLSSLENRKALRDIESIDILNVTRECIEALYPVSRLKELQIEVLGSGGAIKGERFLIRHALLNLLQNSIDFSPHGGKITIRLDKEEDRISVQIKDQGPGIPDYALAQIFDRFYSLKRPDTGQRSSGLGLSLVKEVVDLHNGEVVLHNVAGGGAEAVMRLQI